MGTIPGQEFVILVLWHDGMLFEYEHVWVSKQNSHSAARGSVHWAHASYIGQSNTNFKKREINELFLYINFQVKLVWIWCCILYGTIEEKALIGNKVLRGVDNLYSEIGGPMGVRVCEWCKICAVKYGSCAHQLVITDDSSWRERKSVREGEQRYWYESFFWFQKDFENKKNISFSQRVSTWYNSFRDIPKSTNISELRRKKCCHRHSNILCYKISWISP
jgi:hypothetical protein